MINRIPYDWTPPMKPEIKAKWLEALRSGKYEQGTEKLHRVEKSTGEQQYCCLGVLCELAFEEGVVTRELHDFTAYSDQYFYGNDEDTARSDILPPEVMKWAGVAKQTPAVLHGGTYVKVSHLNDSDELNFLQIADAIEGSL